MLPHREKDVKKISDKNWWKIIPGIILVLIALVCFVVYYMKPENMIMPVLFVFTGLPGAYLIYSGWNRRESGFTFTGTKTKKKITGNENCINIYAYRSSETGRDIPLKIEFVEMVNPPKGQRHYVRNLKRHFYENINITSKRKLEAVKLPDKKYCPPMAANLNFTMQPVKDYLEYAPPSTLTKIAPWVLVVAMVVVGILMVVTGPQPTG